MIGDQELDASLYLGQEARQMPLKFLDLHVHASTVGPSSDRRAAEILPTPVRRST